MVRLNELDRYTQIKKIKCTLEKRHKCFTFVSVRVLGFECGSWVNQYKMTKQINLS